MSVNGVTIIIKKYNQIGIESDMRMLCECGML